MDRRWQIVVVVAALLAAGGWFYHRHQLRQRVVAVAPVAECDLNAGPCISYVPGGGSIRFTIEPHPVPVAEPIQLTVAVTGVSAREVEVDFAGVGMNMGYNRPRLKPAGRNAFRAIATLPVCIRQQMEWEARVLLYTDRGIVALPYRFDTMKQRAGAPAGG